MPAVRKVESTNLLDRPRVDPDIFGVHVEELLPKLFERPERINPLEQEVRWVEVEAEGRRVHVGESPPPDRRRGQQVLAARPFVLGEQHRTVLDADPHALVFRELHQRPPGREKPRPVVIDGLQPVAADKPVHRPQPQQRRRSDQPPKMGYRHVGHRRVWIERVGIVAESAEGDAVPVASRQDGVCLGRREVGHIHMRDSGILPLGAANGPAHRLHAGKPLRVGEREHLVKRELREDGGHKPKSHGRSPAVGKAPSVWVGSAFFARASANAAHRRRGG